MSQYNIVYVDTDRYKDRNKRGRQAPKNEKSVRDRPSYSACSSIVYTT
jgi:hypothetical protein